LLTLLSSPVRHTPAIPGWLHYPLVFIYLVREKRMRQRIGWSLGILLLVVVWDTRVDALTAVPRTFGEFVERADCVLIGTVMRVTTAVEPAGEKMYTYVTLADLEVLKGDVPDPAYVLRVRGGVVNTQAEVSPGLPQWEAGGRSILFVQGNVRDLFPVVGRHQGVFRVGWDAARQQEVVRPLQDEAHPPRSAARRPDAQRRSAPPEEGVTVEAFVQRIAAHLHPLPSAGPSGSPSRGGATP
jgi:hypothetical protein